MYLPASADMSAWESVSIIEKRSSVCRSNNGQNHSKRLRMQKWLCGKTQSRSTLCLFGRGFVCVCSQSSSTYPQCNLTTNSSGSVSCVLCFSQLMSPQAEKSRQQRSCTLSWHAQQVLRFDTVLFAVAYELFQVSLWGFCHIHPFSSAYPIRITERLELPPAAVGWETGSILDMSPFLSL